jgi:RNA polymerase sigma-70 factor (ECF subfamily)
VVEAFEKMIDRRHDFATLPRLKNFLYTTVHNACINEVLARKRHRLIHERIRYVEHQHQIDEDPIENEMLRAELLQEIYLEMDNLPNRCGQIFKMIFVDQLSTQQVAEQLSIDPQTVRTAKARAIQLIRTALLKKNRLQALFLFYILTGLHIHN